MIINSAQNLVSAKANKSGLSVSENRVPRNLYSSPHSQLTEDEMCGETTMHEKFAV